MTNPDNAARTATTSITLDCADPDVLAAFWSEALGYQEIARVDNFVVLGVGGAFKLALQKVPEARTGKNRLHIDIWVADIDSEAARLEALGAKRLQEEAFHEHGLSWYQFADPEGNEFCVARA